RPGSRMVAGPSVFRDSCACAEPTALSTRSGLLRTRELHGRDVRRDPRALEHDLAVARVHDDRLAGAELLPQQLLGQRILDESLDRASERPRPARAREP